MSKEFLDAQAASVEDFTQSAYMKWQKDAVKTTLILQPSLYFQIPDFMCSNKCLQDKNFLVIKFCDFSYG